MKNFSQTQLYSEAQAQHEQQVHDVVPAPATYTHRNHGTNNSQHRKFFRLHAGLSKLKRPKAVTVKLEQRNASVTGANCGAGSSPHADSPGDWHMADIGSDEDDFDATRSFAWPDCANETEGSRCCGDSLDSSFDSHLDNSSLDNSSAGNCDMECNYASPGDWDSLFHKLSAYREETETITTSISTRLSFFNLDNNNTLCVSTDVDHVSVSRQSHGTKSYLWNVSADALSASNDKTERSEVFHPLARKRGASSLRD